MQIRRKVLLLGEEQKEKKCTHQLNKSRCSDNGANSIGQTTDIGGIKRDGRLKISLNCHDNGHRIHIQAYTTAHRATPRHATPCHAVRIIKRNYCRAVVNNALLLKCVPASARGYFASCADCVGKSFARARAGLRCVLSRHVRFPQLTLTWRCSPLTWWSGRVRISCLMLATLPAMVESYDPVSQKPQKIVFWHISVHVMHVSFHLRYFLWFLLAQLSAFRVRLFLC